MKIVNKKALFDYTILDRYEAGVVLTGAEVKSLREGRGRLDSAYVKIIGSDPVLVNAEISPYSFAQPEDYDPKRTRRLLLHKNQILNLMGKMASSNLTIVPLDWHIQGHNIKLEIGLARGKKEYEKREKIKREDLKRDLEREFRGKVK